MFLMLQTLLGCGLVLLCRNPPRDSKLSSQPSGVAGCLFVPQWRRNLMFFPFSPKSLHENNPEIPVQGSAGCVALKLSKSILEKNCSNLYINNQQVLLTAKTFLTLWIIAVCSCLGKISGVACFQPPPHISRL